MTNLKDYKPPLWVKAKHKIQTGEIKKQSCVIIEKDRRYILPIKVNRIYLSGGMEYAKDYGVGWRDKIEQELGPLGYEFFNPPNEERGVLNDHQVTPAFVKELKKWETLPRAANIVSALLDADQKEIERNSDALIIYWDKSILGGGGSAMEVGWAYQKQIPIFLVLGQGMTLEKTSLSIISKATHVFTTLDGFLYHMAWAKEFEKQRKISPLYERPRFNILKKIRGTIKA